MTIRDYDYETASSESDYRASSRYYEQIIREGERRPITMELSEEKIKESMVKVLSRSKDAEPQVEEVVEEGPLYFDPKNLLI